ncbi:MAG: glycosyltransferase [Cyanobacteria bacterium]|nr:glycosyltransferase [Cyanobacteriota bacterium]MDW8200308.1 glycosyltransferase [Cyanobacteriota bacterium SKYGB_h_bin112]
MDFKSQVHQHFEQIAPVLDQWNQRNRYYYRDLERLHQFLIPPNSRVLEIGCGTGDLLAAVTPNLGVGIDFSAAMVAIAHRKHPHLQFHCLDAEQISAIDNPVLEAAPFDYILLAGVLGYLSDIQTVLDQLHQLCHPKTRLILTFHNYLWEPLLHLAERLGQRRPQPQQNWLSMADVMNLLAITDYVPIKQGRRFLLPKRIPLVADWINRYLAPLPGITHLCLTNYVVARPHYASLSLGDRPAPTCSVIIPARNEAGNIAGAIERLPRLGSHTEVIFVEGHSRDNTWEAIQQVMQQASDRPHLTIKAWQQTGNGKADAVRLGFAQATGDILMILDADLTVPPEELSHFYDVIVSGRGEFINGSRLVYPRSAQAMPWLNTLANKFFASVFSFLLGQRLKDTLCGTKVLWRSDYERIAAGRAYFGEFDPFGDFDLLFGATKLNLHIVEVPVRYQPRSYGQSNIAHVREGLVLLRMCGYASRKLKFI